MALRRTALLLDSIQGELVFRRVWPNHLAHIQYNELGPEDQIDGSVPVDIARLAPSNQVDERSEIREHAPRVPRKHDTATRFPTTQGHAQGRVLDDSDELDTRLFMASYGSRESHPSGRIATEYAPAARASHASEAMPPELPPPVPPSARSSADPLADMPAPRLPEMARPAARSGGRSIRPHWFLFGLSASAAVSTLGTVALLRFYGPATEPDVNVRSVAGETLLLPAAIDTRLQPATAASTAAEPAALPQSAAKPATRASRDDDATSDDEADTRSSARAQRRKAHMGTLRLRSNLPSAVYVDGKYVGNTPLRGLTLRAGSHKVALENAVTNQRETFTIRVKAGSTISKNLELPDGDE